MSYKSISLLTLSFLILFPLNLLGQSLNDLIEVHVVSPHSDSYRTLSPGIGFKGRLNQFEYIKIYTKKSEAFVDLGINKISLRKGSELIIEYSITSSPDLFNERVFIIKNEVFNTLPSGEDFYLRISSAAETISYEFMFTFQRHNLLLANLTAGYLLGGEEKNKSISSRIVPLIDLIGYSYSIYYNNSKLPFGLAGAISIVPMDFVNKINLESYSVGILMLGFSFKFSIIQLGMLFDVWYIGERDPFNDDNYGKTYYIYIGLELWNLLNYTID